MAAPPFDFAAQARALRAEAARVRDDAEEKARALEEQAAHLEAFPGRLAKKGLSVAKISAMFVRVTDGQAIDAKRKASAAGALHPFQAWFFARKEAPRSSTEVAAALQDNDQRVRSWFRRKEPVRITAETAAEIERLWGFQATPANWPNGIKPPPRRPRPRRKSAN